jgi:hypothetical protein
MKMTVYGTAFCDAQETILGIARKPQPRPLLAQRAIGKLQQGLKISTNLV